MNRQKSLFCCRTVSLEQATDGAETAAIDGLILSWSENISVSFCPQAPGCGMTLWCALGLLVEGAQYKCLSYSYRTIGGEHRSRGRYDNLWSVLRPGQIGPLMYARYVHIWVMCCSCYYSYSCYYSNDV